MNTKNNKRKKASQERIERAFMDLVQTKEANEITVSDLCKLAKLNRSTFYANYLDIIDLIDNIRERMLEDFSNLYLEENKQKYNSNDFSKIFRHIKENQIFYKTYFKLQFDRSIEILHYDTELAKKYYNNQHISYHAEFFRAGITAIIKQWLNNDCDLSPEELFDVVKEEYANKHTSNA